MSLIVSLNSGGITSLLLLLLLLVCSLLTCERNLNVQSKPIDRHPLRVVVKRPRQALGHPGIVPRPKHASERIGKIVAVRLPRELVPARAPAEAQEDLLPVRPLARRHVGDEPGAAGLELVLRVVDDPVVARAGVDRPAALVPEVGARVAVRLGREEVDEGDGDGVYVGLLAVVVRRSTWSGPWPLALGYWSAESFQEAVMAHTVRSHSRPRYWFSR